MSLCHIIAILCLTVSAVQSQVPPKVTGVSVSKAAKEGNPTLRVTWTALQNVANLLEYQVEYRRNGEFNWDNTVSAQPYSTSTLLPALLPGTEYNVRVRAVSTAGEGEWSEMLTETTFSRPNRVTYVSVTKSVEKGNFILTVSWSTPKSELPITEYEVEYRRSGTTPWINSTLLLVSPPANSTVLTGLDAGMEYIIRVRALSEIGAGAWSEEQRARTDNIPPKVTGVSVSKDAKDGKPTLNVTWTALQNVENLLRYHVEYRRNGEFYWGNRVNHQPYTTSTLLPALLPGTEYNVRMRAVSTAGDGEWSEVMTEKTFDRPNRATYVSVTKSVEKENFTLIVSWTTPQSELPITEYEVEYRRSGTTSWINSTRLSVSPPASSTILTGLDAGVEYIVRVRAVSEIGAGGWSEEHRVRTDDNNCIGPGFTQAIPAQQEWSQYSTTVLKPGDTAVYSSLSFACNGTLQSLAIPTIVRGNIYRYWNQYLYIVVSVWRFNETGYYQVREFQDSVKVTEQAVLQVSRFGAILNAVSIFPQMEVLAKDTLAFRLLLPYNSSLGPVYRHVPFLFKPGPSPGTFTPIVSATFTASSGPVTDEEDSTQSPANGTEENNILQNEGVIFGILLCCREGSNPVRRN